MIIKKNLKLFLSFLSLVAFISCSAGDKLGSETQGSRIGESGNTVEYKKSNLPRWEKGHVLDNSNNYNYGGELDGTWQPINGRGYLIWISGGGLVHVRGGYNNEYEAAI